MNKRPDVKRYEPIFTYRERGLVIPDMKPYSKGDYVLYKDFSTLQEKYDKAVGTIKEIESLCDGENPSQESIWRIAYDFLKGAKE